MKKTIFTSLMLFSVLFVNAQDEDKKTQLGLFVGPAFGKISNINIDEDPFASVKNNANIMFGLNNFMSNNGSKEYENILGGKKPMADFNISQFAIKLGVVFDL